MDGMSETTNNTADAGDKGGSEAQEFKAPATQEELDRIIQKRVERERAKFADYDELKAKASRLAELEDSSKAEIQRAQERADAAERALSDATIAAARAEIAAEKGVPIALLTGDTREALAASADALVNFRNETARQGNYVPSEGRNSNIDKGGDALAYVNSLWDRAQAN